MRAYRAVCFGGTALLLVAGVSAWAQDVVMRRPLPMDRGATVGTPTPTPDATPTPVPTPTPTPTPGTPEEPVTSLPEPELPVVPTEPEDFAVNLRILGAAAYQAAGRMIAVPSTREQLELPYVELRDKAYFLPDAETIEVRGGDSVVFRMNVRDSATCARVEKLLGNADEVAPVADFSRMEGCGQYYGWMTYWRRIDPAQASRQAAYLRANAVAASTALGEHIRRTGKLPSTYAAASYPTPQLYNIANDFGHPYAAFADPGRLMHRSNVLYNSICSAMSIAAGGPGERTGWIGADFSQAEGCGGWYGDRKGWYDTSAHTDGPIAEVAAKVSKYVEDAAAATVQYADSYAALRISSPLTGMDVMTDGFESGFGEVGLRQFWFTQVPTDYACRAINQAVNGAGIFPTSDMDSETIGRPDEGCGKYYGYNRYWKRIDVRQRPLQVAYLHAIGEQVREAARARTTRPRTFDEIGMSEPDLKGLGTFSLFTRDPVFQRFDGNEVMVIQLRSAGLCTAIDRANGGTVDVYPWVGTGFGKSEGCTGYYGYLWYYKRLAYDGASTPTSVPTPEDQPPPTPPALPPTTACYSGSGYLWDQGSNAYSTFNGHLISDLPPPSSGPYPRAVTGVHNAQGQEVTGLHEMSRGEIVCAAGGNPVAPVTKRDLFSGGMYTTQCGLQRRSTSSVCKWNGITVTDSWCDYKGVPDTGFMYRYNQGLSMSLGSSGPATVAGSDNVSCTATGGSTPDKYNRLKHQDLTWNQWVVYVNDVSWYNNRDLSPGDKALICANRDPNEYITDMLCKKYGYK